MGTGVSGQPQSGLGVLMVNEPCWAVREVWRASVREQHSGSMWKERGEGGKAMRQKNSLDAGIPRGCRDTHRSLVCCVV